MLLNARWTDRLAGWLNFWYSSRYSFLPRTTTTNCTVHNIVCSTVPLNKVASRGAREKKWLSPTMTLMLGCDYGGETDESLCCCWLLRTNEENPKFDGCWWQEQKLVLLQPSLLLLVIVIQSICINIRSLPLQLLSRKPSEKDFLPPTSSHEASAVGSPTDCRHNTCNFSHFSSGSPFMFPLYP